MHKGSKNIPCSFPLEKQLIDDQTFTANSKFRLLSPDAGANLSIIKKGGAMKIWELRACAMSVILAFSGALQYGGPVFFTQLFLSAGDTIGGGRARTSAHVPIV